jgi:hypothetical protein
MSLFSLRTSSLGDTLRTRDGRAVLAWRVVEDPATSLWPVEVDVMTQDRVLTYLVNQNGRRYANVKSGDDVLVVDEHHKCDCMPDAMSAIEAVRRGDLAGARSANKDKPVIPQPINIRVEIGSYCD